MWVISIPIGTYIPISHLTDDAEVSAFVVPCEKAHINVKMRCTIHLSGQ